MKSLTAIFLMCVLTSLQAVWAHDDPNHQHGHITEFVALLIAEKTITQLTQQDAGLGFGQLAPSWNELPSDKLTFHKKGNGYYIVAGTNDSEGKTLYLLMSSENGNVYDANFTGDFPDLKQ